VKLGAKLKKIKKFDGQLGVQLNKSKTKDHNENDTKLQG
jgi:hypothetical protein